MYQLLLSSVPYDASMWKEWWTAIMHTIGSASRVGMIAFIVLTVISVFKLVVKRWFS